MAQAAIEHAIRPGDLIAGRRAPSPLEVTFSPAESRRGRGSTLSSAITWALPGFIFGTIFWHFVGFWGFVSQVVLGEVPAEQAGPSPLIAVMGAREPAVGSGYPLDSACVALALDRATGATRSRACDGRPMASLHEQVADKGDLASLRPRPTSAPALISRGGAAPQSGTP